MYLSDAAQAAKRLTMGHTEAFIESCANVSLGAAEAILARQERRARDPLVPDFPTVEDGARGVHFIEKAVESGQSDRKWTEARWNAAVTV